MSLESYGNNLDRNDSVPYSGKPEKKNLGIMAEHVVIDFFNEKFPGQISVRQATAIEDSGLEHVAESKQIDAVMYDSNNVPLMCAQITTARDSVVRMKKCYS